MVSLSHVDGRLWLGTAVAVLGLMAVAPQISAEERDGPRLDRRESHEETVGAVNRELGDVARALRRLDQSYTFRGIRSRGASTAGSVFVDWDSRGVAVEDRVRVSPPPPLVLSGAECSRSGSVELRETTNPVPASPPVAASVPCETGVPCPAQAPCQNCGEVPSAGSVGIAPVDCPCEAGRLARQFLPGPTFPAPVYTRGSGCGGRTPPCVSVRNGRYVEQTALWGGYHLDQFPSEYRTPPQPTPVNPGLPVP